VNLADGEALDKGYQQGKFCITLRFRDGFPTLDLFETNIVKK
jgi:hypothetical protein